VRQICGLRAGAKVASATCFVSSNNIAERKLYIWKQELIQSMDGRQGQTNGNSISYFFFLGFFFVTPPPAGGPAAVGVALPTGRGVPARPMAA
jgi:hypothetical protein